MRLPSWLPILPVAAALALGACGGGGCGAEPGPSTGAQPGQGEAPGKKPVSGGSVDFSEFDSKKWDQQDPKAMQYSGGPNAASGGRRRALPPPQADWLDPVNAADWATTVEGSAKPVLVMISRERCKDCALAGAALHLASQKMPEAAFRRFDSAAPEAPSLLPSGLPARPLPNFVLYDGGKPVSRLVGLPFPRAQDESDADYRNRLYRWFRDAVTQKDLQFGRR